MISATAAAARPTISPPRMRGLNGNVAAVLLSRTLCPSGKIAEYGLGVCSGAGDTFGNRPPNEFVLDALGVAGGPDGVVPMDVVPGGSDGRPTGSSVPTPAGFGVVGPVVAEADGVGDGLAATVNAAFAAGGAVAPVPLAVALRVTFWSAASVFGTATVACSSSYLPLAMSPAVHVCPRADGQTVNFGVTAWVPAFAVICTLIPLPAASAAQTQTA